MKPTHLPSAVPSPVRCLLLVAFVLTAAPLVNAAALIIDISDGPTASNPPGDDGSPGVLYNGATGSAILSTTPLWWQTNGSTLGYNGSRERFSAVGGGAGQTAVWTFTGLAPGTYSVHTFYFAGANRTTVAPFEIFDGIAGTTLLASPTVNQELAPNDLTTDDGQGVHTWEELSSGVGITTGTLSVRLTSVENAGNVDFVIADAIRIELIPEPGVASLLGFGGILVLLRRRR